MSDQDNFIARWSRLKREAAESRRSGAEAEAAKRAPDDPRAPQSPAQPSAEPGRGPRPATAEDAVLDPATLPPIESILADSDIRAFLQKGVPAELTKAALRRAWAADPAIRDFIGLAENQWDFTDPTAIPGFGTLEATGDTVRQLVAQALGELPDETEPVPQREECAQSVAAAEAGPAPELPEPEKPHDPAAIDVAPHGSEQPPPERPQRRRSHGGAVPQ